MGGKSSKVSYGNLTKDEIVELMMPAYYTPSPHISAAILETAKEAWLKILENRSNVVRSIKNNDGWVGSTSGISMFYTTFFDRLFDVHPLAKPLFSGGMQAQGKAIVKMVSMILNTFKNPEKFEKMVKEVASSHCRMGVKAAEFAIVGDVLFYSLKRCLGEEYTTEVEDAWKKIYSAMLQLIVPFCLTYESKGSTKDTQVKAIREKLDPLTATVTQVTSMSAEMSTRSTSLSM